MTNQPASRGLWTWWVCGLLLCASTINYMDRQTLANASVRITKEFDLSEEQYAMLESRFAYTFAVGAPLFGFIADRANIRWLYPLVLLLWSLMGFLTGFAQTFDQLIICRMFLALFEAGHWPCALKTTYRLLPPESRTLGNSVLQSGTAIGAIIVPIMMTFMLTDSVGSWRPVFQIIAAIGVFWVVAWIPSTRSADLAPRFGTESSTQQEADGEETFFRALFSRKVLVLAIVVIAINATWHLFRVWMPKFLISGRGFEEKSMFGFMTFYNIATDVGCLSAGLLTRFLHRSGASVHASRCWVFGICALFVAMGGFIPWLSVGPLLVIVLTMVAMGSLGLFPCYYSFSQEVTSRHQGKVQGLLGSLAWVSAGRLHIELGRWADQTHSYDLGLAMSCGFPLLALIVLTCFWPDGKQPASDIIGVDAPANRIEASET